MNGKTADGSLDIPARAVDVDFPAHDRPIIILHGDRTHELPFMRPADRLVSHACKKSCWQQGRQKGVLRKA